MLKRKQLIPLILKAKHNGHLRKINFVAPFQQKQFVAKQQFFSFAKKENNKDENEKSASETSNDKKEEKKEEEKKEEDSVLKRFTGAVIVGFMLVTIFSDGSSEQDKIEEACAERYNVLQEFFLDSAANLVFFPAYDMLKEIVMESKSQNKLQIVLVHGPPGSGKTELVNYTGVQYLVHHNNEVVKEVRSVKQIPMTTSIDCSTEETIYRGLVDLAHELNYKHANHNNVTQVLSQDMASHDPFLIICNNLQDPKLFSIIKSLIPKRWW